MRLFRGRIDELKHGQQGKQEGMDRKAMRLGEEGGGGREGGPVAESGRLPKKLG